jgi:hypothetical protein
MKNRKE